MSKRQRKHNHVVSSVLAAALAFTAIVSSVQLASVSDDLAANVGGRYVASHVTPASCVAPMVYDAPTDSCIAGGGSVGGGGGTISCNSLNSQQVTPAVCDAADVAKNSCTASGGTWNGSGSGSCTAAGGGGAVGGGASSYVTEPTCVSAHYFWYNNVCNSIAQVVGGAAGTASSYTTQPTCQTAGYFWYNNVCNSTAGGSTTTTTTTGTAYPAGTCSNGTSYPAGTGTPPCGTTSTVGSCTTGQYWDAATSTCKTSTQGTTQCSQGQYWNGTSCATSTYDTVVDTVDKCQARGGTWDAASSSCYAGVTGATPATTACGYNQYWDGTACVAFPTTFYREDFQYNQTKDPAYYGQQGDQAGCESNGWYWDSKGHGGTGDCFPQKPSAFGMNQPTMGKIPFGMTGTPAEPAYDYGTQWTNFEEFKGGYSQEMDWCETPQGRADQNCWYETEGEFDFFNDLKEGGEASERDRDMLGQLRKEIDFVTAKTGGAYCKGIEKAEEVYTKAYENPAFLAGVGPEMQRVFEALHQCEGKIQVLQNLEQLAKKLGSLKVSKENEKAKADLVARVAAYQADPTPLLDFEAGPDGMRELWEAFEMLRGNGRQFESEMGPCIQLEYMYSDIERWTTGDTAGMEGAPPMDDKSLEMADEALVMIDDALAKGDKKACKLVLRDLERMGQEMGMSEDGPRFYDGDQMMMQNIYGDDFDFSSLKAELLAELKAELLGSLKELIQNQIATIIKDQLKIAFADLETRIAESVILSKVTAQMNVVGEKLDSDAQEELNQVFAERLSYYPPEFHEEAEANREIAGELLEPIFENVPEDLIKDAGLDDRAELVYTELLPEAIAANIADPELILQVQNTIASSIDSDGEVKTGKEEALVRMLTEVAEHIDEQAEDLEKEQTKEGLRPLDKFTDKAEIADWGRTALEGAIFAGESSCEAVIKGEGDGSMNPSGELLGAHVYTMIDRILCTDGNKSEVAGLTTIDWAAEPAAAIRDLGVIDDDDVRSMAEPMNRGETISTLVRAMAASDDEMKEAVEEAPWTLSEAGLSRDAAITELGSAEAADAANFAYATGMMTGQTRSDGTKDLDFDGQFNRLQSVKVSAVGMGVMNRVQSEGADALLDTIEENFGGASIIDPIYNPGGGTGDASIGSGSGN